MFRDASPFNGSATSGHILGVLFVYSLIVLEYYRMTSDELKRRASKARRS